MLITDEPHVTAPANPEALIEEARARRRQRRRQRATILFAAVIILALAIGIAQLSRGGTPVKSSRPPGAAAGSGSVPSVIYEKVELTSFGIPRVKVVFGTWISSNRPRAWRDALAGRPTIEPGQALVRDPTMGLQLLNYLYDKRTNKIYVLTRNFPPRTRPAATMAQAFRLLLAAPGAHLAGTRTYDGQRVDVVTIRGGFPPDPVSVFYIDPQNYLPVYFSYSLAGAVGSAGYYRVGTVERVLAWKNLPATPANLKLASLAAAHPGARVVPEQLVHLSGNVYNTEPARIPGVSANVLRSPLMVGVGGFIEEPPYWLELTWQFGH